MHKTAGVTCKIKVSDKTATVTPTPRHDLGPNSDSELHFPSSPLRNFGCERERHARLVTLEALTPGNRW